MSIPTAATEPTAERWVTAHIGTGFHTRISARAHEVHADEPLTLGGTDMGMTPYELLLASLSSCMAMTMRLYADHKGWPLESADVQLRTAPSRDADSVARSPDAGTVTHIERHIELRGALSEEQRARIIGIADRCPMKRHLEGGIQVVSAT